MKVLIELELSGDFSEDLSEDEIEEMLDKVIEYGSESCCLTGKYVLKKVINN